MDRRKRILRENLPTDEETGTAGASRGRARRLADAGQDDSEEPQRRRSAGYSQDVRRACQHRLVQLIPVRRRAYFSALTVSLAIPAILLVLHYWIYVNGYLNWYGQPMAVMLDASHPRGIAAWLSGQVWLLCLAATVLTFQLRRHKLDDYNGDYRLWFWLVSTCVIGSLDSTTRVIDLFGDALNRWSQLNLGWSGPAVVQATLAVLVGMLGVRLCSELKSVPTSLVFWLVGLVAWAGSAALGQQMLKLDMSIQMRIWLRSALWLGGLTAIWLSALSYLRVVYIEAQRRFLLRGKLAASVSSTWKERLSESLPAMPKFRLRRPDEESVAESVAPKKRSKKSDAQTDAPEQTVEKQRRKFGLPQLVPNFMKRRQPDSVGVGDIQRASSSRDVLSSAGETQRGEAQRADTQRADNQRADARPSTSAGAQVGSGPLSQARRAESAAAPKVTAAASGTGAGKAKADEEQAAPSSGKRSWLSRFVSKPNMSDDAPEYAKVDKATRIAERQAAKQEQLRLRDEARAAKKAAAQQAAEQKAAAKGNGDGQRRGWLPKMSMPKMKMPSLPAPKMPKIGLPKIGLPKMKLPSLRLPPPESTTPAQGREDLKGASKPDVRPLPPNKPLPTTSGPAQQSIESAGRPLSKAERKRLRRMQDDQDYDVEDRRAA